MYTDQERLEQAIALLELFGTNVLGDQTMLKILLFVFANYELSVKYDDSNGLALQMYKGEQTFDLFFDASTALGDVFFVKQLDDKQCCSLFVLQIVRTITKLYPSKRAALIFSHEGPSQTYHLIDKMIWLNEPVCSELVRPNGQYSPYTFRDDEGNLMTKRPRANYLDDFPCYTTAGRLKRALDQHSIECEEPWLPYGGCQTRSYLQ